VGSTVGIAPRPHPSPSWTWFAVWAAVGGIGSLGFLSLGLLVLLPVVIATGVLASRASSRRSAFGLLSGAGILLLVIAYLHRQGPGTICWHRGSASGCDEYLDPIPWLIIGMLFLLGGIVAQVLVNRTRGR
jgi:hypothetical protein